jgi:hypothetical protein
MTGVQNFMSSEIRSLPKDIVAHRKYGLRTLFQLHEIKQDGNEIENSESFHLHRWRLWLWAKPDSNLLFQKDTGRNRAYYRGRKAPEKYTQFDVVKFG